MKTKQWVSRAGAKTYEIVPNEKDKRLTCFAGAGKASREDQKGMEAKEATRDPACHCNRQHARGGKIVYEQREKHDVY